MSYIGIPPQANFSSGLLDRFTSTTGTTVTLTHDIASENDIVVFVNFVKQDSTTYSVGGTGNKTLTLGGTLVSSDIVEVHYLNIVGQTNAPSSGSVGSSQLTADVITGQTALAVAPDSTDELLISDGGTLKRIDVSLVGGNNTPSWRATMSTAQTGNTNNTAVLASFDTEDFDTDSAYTNSSSNYKFTVPSGKAGKYFIGANLNIGEEGDNADLQQKRCLIYKNGSAVAEGRDQFSSSVIQGSTLNFIGAFTIQNLSVGDYIQVYGQAYNSNFDLQTSNAEFYGFKLTG